MALNIQEITNEIVDQYLADENPRPWIIGFSGGKDSTMLLQVVWYALKSLPPESLNRKVYVVCNNTLVENPKIIQFNESVLQKIEAAAVEQSLPIFVKRTSPKLEDTFWVNLIGKGYPAPSNGFRWCTERLKISPTTEFIKEKISEDGQAIILLGTRFEESANRAQSIKKHSIIGQHRLRKHLLPNAYVFSPIENVLVKELWQYLNQIASPWGADNKQLNALYRNANGGDCPLVIDDTTPSCGNSRFGCWVCTVVAKDKSMEALIVNGEDWMEPLMDIRNILVKHRYDPDWRMSKLKNGTEKEGQLGPYFPEKRALMLEQILMAQKKIQQSEPWVSLINYQELVAIQVTWFREGLFNFKVAEIYNKVYGKQMVFTEINSTVIKEQELLKEACKDHPSDVNLINDLLTLQKSKTILMKSRGLQNDLEIRLEQEGKQKNN